MNVLQIAAGIALIVIGILLILIKANIPGNIQALRFKAEGPVGLLIFFVGAYLLYLGSTSSTNRLLPTPSSPAAQSTAQPSAIHSVGLPTTSGPTERPAVSLKFYKPHKGEELGRQITVELTGAVPRGEQLWIFVYSSHGYYVQDPPSWQPPFWFSSDVNLGSTDAGDINALYTIYAVLANSQANSAIQQDLNRTGGNTGTPVIPGGSGAKKVAYVTVTRTR
jgi:hypothetical protein